MPDYSSRRRILKRLCLAGCIGVIGVWFASVIWAVPVQTPARSWGFIVGDGGVAVWWGMRIWMTPDRSPVVLVSASGGTGLHMPQRRNFADGTGVLRIPFWLILIPLAIPTAWLWWRDSQRPPGTCPGCRYDLTGNTSGVCPECGMRITTGARA